jgi:hypothetical protein
MKKNRHNLSTTRIHIVLTQSVRFLFLKFLCPRDSGSLTASSAPGTLQFTPDPKFVINVSFPKSKIHRAQDADKTIQIIDFQWFFQIYQCKNAEDDEGDNFLHNF